MNHSKRFIAFVFLFFLSTISQATDLVVRAADVVGYGIFETSSITRGENFTSSSIAKDNVKGVRFVEYTNNIPAHIGLNFGFQYVINSQPQGKKILVTSVIKFPEAGLQRPKGRLYKESRDTHEVTIGHKSLHGYGFDEDWEMVPGTWVFELWYKDARLIKKTFNVSLSDKDP